MATNSKNFIHKGMDVSHHQKDIDWKKVKSSGIEFAIIKAGGSDGKTSKYYKDDKFEENYKKAKAAGISVGAYYYVGKDFTTVAEGKKQAKLFIEMLNGKYFDYPVVVDIEETAKSNKDKTTVAAIAFCDALEAAGYYAMIYGSDVSTFKERLDSSRLVRFDKWVARYSSSNSANVRKAPEYVSTYGIWQYTSKGKVDGISGNVDLDFAYEEYPEIIKRVGLNGYKGKIQNGTKTLDDVADEVIAGLWGNGNARKTALTKAGYIYNEVQVIVNRKLGIIK